VDVPASTSKAPGAEPRPSSRRVLLAIGSVVLLLCVAFGVTTLRSRDQYRRYKESTLESGPLPWTQQEFSVQQCVEYSTDWAMECPGVESWCSNEAPHLTRQCLASQDRRSYCEEQGDATASTSFGYKECEQLRESVQGRYTKRAHKKHCAASFRAVASWCAEMTEK
jgi:hypothetical protein